MYYVCMRFIPYVLSVHKNLFSSSFCKKKGNSKHDVFSSTITKNSIDLIDKAFGDDEGKKSLPVEHKSQSSINSIEMSQ